MQWIENWNLNAKIENNKKIRNRKLYSKVSNVNFMKLQLLVVRYVNCHYFKYEFFCILVGGNIHWPSTQYCVLLYHANFRYDYGTLGSLGTISDRFRDHMSITMHKKNACSIVAWMIKDFFKTQTGPAILDFVDFWRVGLSYTLTFLFCNWKSIQAHVKVVSYMRLA